MWSSKKFVALKALPDQKAANMSELPPVSFAKSAQIFPAMEAAEARWDPPRMTRFAALIFPIRNTEESNAAEKGAKTISSFENRESAPFARFEKSSAFPASAAVLSAKRSP